LSIVNEMKPSPSVPPLSQYTPLAPSIVYPFRRPWPRCGIPMLRRCCICSTFRREWAILNSLFQLAFFVAPYYELNKQCHTNYKWKHNDSVHNILLISVFTILIKQIHSDIKSDCNSSKPYNIYCPLIFKIFENGGYYHCCEHILGYVHQPLAYFLFGLFLHIEKIWQIRFFIFNSNSPQKYTFFRYQKTFFSFKFQVSGFKLGKAEISFKLEVSGFKLGKAEISFKFQVSGFKLGKAT